MKQPVFAKNSDLFMNGLRNDYPVERGRYDEGAYCLKSAGVQNLLEVIVSSLPLLCLMAISQRLAMLTKQLFLPSSIIVFTSAGNLASPFKNQINVCASKRYFILTCNL